jgi:hypothetical protein
MKRYIDYKFLVQREGFIYRHRHPYKKKLNYFLLYIQIAQLPNKQHRLKRRMSYRAPRTNNGTRKPYCKVCHDAGKPEKDYTSHYVKSTNRLTGICETTCPTLLNTECRYCFELGHTAKFCPIIASKNKMDDRRQREDKQTTSVAKPAPKLTRTASTNVYSVLDETDSEKEVEKEVKKEEFPPLAAPSKRMPSGNYAAAAKKPVPVQEAKVIAQGFHSGFQVLSIGTKYAHSEKPEKEMYILDVPEESDDEW